MKYGITGERQGVKSEREGAGFGSKCDNGVEIELYVR